MLAGKEKTANYLWPQARNLHKNMHLRAFVDRLPAVAGRASLVTYSSRTPVATVSSRVQGKQAGYTARTKALMPKAANLKILYGEGDADEQAKTTAAFETAGHSVEKAIGRKAVEAALRKGSYDLVVLGPTLTRNDRHHLPYMAKKAQSHASVLVMHADGSRHPYVDACTDTGASAENVLARIESMKIAGMIPAAAGAASGR